MALKKRAKTKDKPTKGYHFEDPIFKKACPQLYEHLAAMTFDDGDKRSPSKITLFIQDGVVKVFLNDVDAEESLCVASDDVTGLWNVLEAAVGASDAEWRKSPWAKGEKKKK